MPELPEIETIVRELAPALAGRLIRDVEFLSRLILLDPPQAGMDFLRGRCIISLIRQGKFIVCRVDRGFLTFHLGMTGKLLLDSGKGPYTRAVFALDSGSLRFDDIRQFGRIEWGECVPARVERLGADPLSISASEFIRQVRRHSGHIKPLLLNQTFLAGLGNIYTDEVLHRAGIHPRTRATRLGRERCLRLHRAIVEVLSLAIEHRGSSISDYVDASGRQGSFQLLHQVYGKPGQPCPRCGTPIRRIVIAQRGTHFCPDCQKH